MIQRMGLAKQLVGVTFECHAEEHIPRVVRSVLEGKQLSSDEIDRVVQEHMRSDTPLYSIEMEMLEELGPDVIFTQHVCNVCQIGTAVVEQAICGLDKPAKIVPLVPRTFEEVLGNALTIAEELGDRAAGERHVAEIRARCRRVRELVGGSAEAVNGSGAGRGVGVDVCVGDDVAPVRVAFIEWIEPVFNSGHWIPDMVALAGGVDVLGVPGGHSGPIDWARVVESDPDAIVVAPCGLPLDQAERDMAALAAKPGWSEMRAIREGRVYLVHPDLFTCPSTSLVEGVELLAALLHPERLAMPTHSADRWRPWPAG